MGVDPVTLTLAAVAAGGSLYGGYSQKQAYRSEASLLEDQGRLQLQESYDEADRRAKEIRKFASKQKLAFIKNGVQFSGSALDVVDETLTEGQKEVNSVVKRGQALYDLRFREADRYRKMGRAALIGGFGGAAESFLGAKKYLSKTPGQTGDTGIGSGGTV